MQRKREHLSIELFGRPTFYAGVAIGLAIAILSQLFFIYGFEILRSTTIYSADFLAPVGLELFAYDLFFAGISFAIGFGICAWFWLHNPRPFKISVAWIQFIRLYLLCGSLILAVVVIRTANYISMLLFGLDGYDNELNFYEEIPELLFLLPTVFFFNVWTVLRLKFIAGSWFWKSIVMYVCGSLVLALFVNIDQSKINANWSKINRPYNDIVDREIKRAKGHGIEVSSADAEILKLNRKGRVRKMALSLKHRFGQPTAVQGTDVVKELILIKKSTFDYIGQDDGWPYPYPSIIFEQLQITRDTVTFDYLMEILEEYRSIFRSTDEEDWKIAERNGAYMTYETRERLRQRVGGMIYFVDAYLDSAAHLRRE
ncbi:MAG TPA: hypothetical protein VG737_03265 [Cyclobacteriaceae bacterium]|nr:hypothetical protein [Cyclobacteriaceae bacterium]